MNQTITIETFAAAGVPSAPGRDRRHRPTTPRSGSTGATSSTRSGTTVRTPSITQTSIRNSCWRPPANLPRPLATRETWRTAFAQSTKTIEAEYYVPHLAHASMEPPVALADYRDGKVTVWASTQNPQAVQEVISQKLGIPKKAVTCHVPLLGGGFGRKSKPDYAAEAAILSKKVGRPVKVVWSREDDIRFDYYHTVSAMYMKAALGADGLPTAWLQRSVFPSIGSTFDVHATAAGAGELQQGWTDLPFNIPNIRAENGGAQHTYA